MIDGGAVLMYSRVQGTWSLQDTINPGLFVQSGFGSSLAFSKDGILAVGAPDYSK